MQNKTKLILPFVMGILVSVVLVLSGCGSSSPAAAGGGGTGGGTTSAPTITSFSPTSGIAGTVVTISGSNFSNIPASNSVTIGGKIATVTAASTTNITTTVPVGTTTGPITVTVGGQTATSASNFIVPTIPGAPAGIVTTASAARIPGLAFNTTYDQYSIILNWTPVAGATSYNIYASSAVNVVISPATKIGTTLTTTYKDAGTSPTLLVPPSLQPMTAYYYKVTAVNAAGESLGSTEVVEDTLWTPPTGVTATAFAPSLFLPTNISIGWTLNAAPKYHIYRATTTGVSVTTVNNISGAGVTATPYLDFAINTGITYHYVVTAIDFKGRDSLPSAEIFATAL